MGVRTTGDPVWTKRLGKRYRRGWALRECSLALPLNRMVALVGANGSGKSTLMGLITGMLRPSEGDVEVFGRRPTGTCVPADVAYVAQQKPLYPRLTVAETLRLAARMNTRWDQERAERLVHEAALPFNAEIRRLSGGQRTRVALAMAFGKRPGLLVLDEPLADLDPLARRAILRTLQQESCQHGSTVLLSSHSLAELEGVCDHVLLLGRGRVRLSGSVEELVAAHRVLRGPGRADPPVRPEDIIDEVGTPEARSLLIKNRGLVQDCGWSEQEPRLNDVVLAYMRDGQDTEVAA